MTPVLTRAPPTSARAPTTSTPTGDGTPPPRRTAPRTNGRPPVCSATPASGTDSSRSVPPRTSPITGYPTCSASRLPVSGPHAVPSDEADPTSTAHRPRASSEAASPIRYDMTSG
ncbi:hypothetical protein GT204_32780 [Streptomyces sp. SID4919]|nr:hypothetical protein [Streptomyces sp. SID4919]SCK32615.1 hypothetical protein YW7DRAFT_02622 [Streptomyces sp. AmelKG-E11A]